MPPPLRVLKENNAHPFCEPVAVSVFPGGKRFIIENDYHYDVVINGKHLYLRLVDYRVLAKVCD